MKAAQLWGKNKEELTKQLDDLKQELVSLRTSKIAGGAQTKLTRMYDALTNSPASPSSGIHKTSRADIS